MSSIFRVLTCWTADPVLGKVEKSSLSHNVLVELFVDGLTDNCKEDLRLPPDIQADGCSWYGVNTNEDGEVVDIEWQRSDIEGALNFRWLPETLWTLFLDGNALEGTIDFTALPRALVRFYIDRNSFSGEADLTRLPASLEDLDIYRNKFHGPINLTALPSGLI